jgi:enolase
MQKTRVQEVFQEVLNELLETRPEDAYGALARLFKKRSLPATIDHLVGREVLDSRGNPTVEVDVYARRLGEVRMVGRSSAPSGASTGSNEARELRDAQSPRYGGKGTQRAARNVSEVISPELNGLPLGDLNELDQRIQKIDGTPLKERLGGNACTATSFALAEAGAAVSGEELFVYLARQYHGADDIPAKFSLPTPFFNILNGGKHAGGNLKLQEFMVSPREDIAFPEQLRMVAEIYQKLGGILSQDFGVSARNLGDEGGFAPLLNTPEDALQVIERAIRAAGYEPVRDVRLGLDAAASEFYNAETGQYEVEVGVFKTGDGMIEYWKDMVERHPAIVSIEDGLDEKDYATWIKLNEALGEKIQLVGDDLYTTNPATIRLGLGGKWANALLLKVNQIGTISEAMDAARLVLQAGQKVMVSHRSGETCNAVIADLAVAIGAQYIKTGSTARGERIQKYTRMLQIYEYLKERDLLA